MLHPDRSAPATVPARPRSLLLIHNPAAGLRRPGRLAHTVAALRGLGAALEIRETTARGDGERFAAEAAGLGVDAVVAAGGDGTVNEVLNGLTAAPSLPLGIIPLGTANVLAGELGLPSDPGELARCLALGPVRSLPMGRANGRLFAQMAGVGLDARVVAGINPWLKRRIGRGAYVLGSWAEILKGPRLDYAVELETPDGRVERHRVSSCIICRGHFYAGRFVLAPAADLAQAQFQVCLYLRPGRLAAFSYASSMVLGGTAARGDVRIVPARRIRVEGPAGEAVQADGEIIAGLPLMVDLAPFILRVLS